MGLDMYLSSRVYLSPYSNPELRTSVLEVLGVTPLTDDCVAIDIPAAYWSKAKTIHDWFVNHVQDGNDNCGSYYVSRDQVTELRDLCKDLLAGKADESALPPTEGFFFGSTTDKDWYRTDLEDTVAQLDRALALPVIAGCGDFHYHASW